MKKSLLIVLLIIGFSSNAFSNVKFWPMSAELWNASDETNKYVYVQGLFDGVIFADIKVHGTELSTRISVDQYIVAIDKLYSDYKNSLIPVPFLMRVVTLELEGNSKESIESVLTEYRARFSKK